LRRGRRKEAKIHQKQTNKRRRGRRKKKRKGTLFTGFFPTPPSSNSFVGLSGLFKGEARLFLRKKVPLWYLLSFYLFHK